MKRILLTGGSGFIGKNVAESYLAQKYEIIAPKRAQLDLVDDESVKNFFEKNKNFDAVIHSACKPSHRNAVDASGIFYSNGRMFFNLERYSNCFGKLINIGSGAIYDMKNYRPKMREDEFTKFIPSDEHGFCKYVLGKYIEASSAAVVDLRVFGIFGKYEDYAIRFISNAICKSIFDLPITLKQNRKFDYIFVDDLLPILEFFIENDAKHKSYNITPDKSLELLGIAEIVKKISQKNLEIKVVQQGLGLEYSGDNSRLKNEMKNFEFEKISLSIERLYYWYLANKSNLNKEFLLTDK